MPPFQKPRSFQHKAFMSDTRETSKGSQSSISNPKITEDSTKKVQDTVGSSKPVTQRNGVQCMPNNSGQFLSNLTKLELSNPDFTELPDFFKYANLKRLYIHDTALIELPDSIGELRNLVDLNLSHNELKKLPETISNLKHLEKLNLSHNQLKDLPSLYAKLQLLRELNLSGNNFRRLPKCIANGMGTLRLLDISENPHVRINVMPSSKYLEKLIARNNKSCGNFPDWILCSKFFNMKEFDFDNTQFEVYTFNGKEGNLYYTKLSMGSSNLSSAYLNMMMEHMIHLQIVNVGNENASASETGNIFHYMPIQNFRNPKLITELNFRGTGLASVPSTINTLCNLKKLDLGLNSISWFPDEFCELQKLENLKLDGNSFIAFPDDIGNLIAIQEIDAEHNALQSLPGSLQKLKSLRLFDLYDNKFKELPEVLGKLVTLEGLDLEFNFFATTDLKIGSIAYTELREYLRKKKCTDSRTLRVKEEESDDEDDYNKSLKDWFGDETSGEANDQFELSCDSEENWDNITDTDDEYEPNSAEINYNERSKKYMGIGAPLGFCPADIHSVPISKEVASMRVYGSMPSYEIEEGQFDDA